MALWTRTFGARIPSAEPIILTPAGQVVVAGFATSGPGTVVAAFDSAGTALWSTVLSSNNALALAAGRSGEFYAVGDGGVMGYLVVKFDAAFNQVWRNIYPARGVASRAAVDLAGNVVVIGSVDTSTGPLTVLVNDWLTLKLDANGTLLWSATHGTPTWFGDVPYAVAVGPDNAIYVTGEGSTQVTDPMGECWCWATRRRPCCATRKADCPTSHPWLWPLWGLR